MKRNGYLYRLYRYNKRLFYGVSAFIVLTLFFNLAGDEVTPFFVWGMYSEKSPPSFTQEIVEVRYKGAPYPYTQTMHNFNRHSLIGPVGFYMDIRDNNNTDPLRTFFESKLGGRYPVVRPIVEAVSNDSARLSEFEVWAASYLASSKGLDPEFIEFFRVTIQKEGYKWVPVKEEKLF